MALKMRKKWNFIHYFNTFQMIGIFEEIIYGSLMYKILLRKQGLKIFLGVIYILQKICRFDTNFNIVMVNVSERTFRGTKNVQK